LGFEEPRSCLPSGPILGSIDSKFATRELMLVELADRLFGLFRAGELYKGKTPRATGGPICGDKDVSDLSDLRKQGGELIFRRVVAEVSYKNLGSDSCAPFSDYLGLGSSGP
jgi:hypothetical protein